MSKHSFGGLRLTLFFALSAPTVLFVMVLTTYVVSARLEDLEVSFANSAQTATEQLASEAVYGVFAADIAYLSSLCDSATKSDQGIERVLITGPEGQTFVDCRNHAEPPNPKDLRRFQSPISAPSMPINHDEISESSELPQSRSLGLVEVFAWDRRITATRWPVSHNALLLIFGLLGVAALLAVTVSRRISAPIIRLSAAFERIRDSDYKARVPETSVHELGELERGFNTMASELQNTNQELKRAVDEATGELRQTMQDLETRNIQLDAAQQDALEASRIKSQFLANMSHEIRTPMNGILGFTRLLRKTELDNTQQEFVDTINTSVSSLLTIVNDILDFSKFESSEIVLANRPFSLRSCIDETISILAPQAHEKHLEFVALVYDDVPDALVGDPTRIRQIVTNLASNAIKFTDAGEVIVRVMLGDKEDTDDAIALMISVADTGIGISISDQVNLFNPFKQGSSPAQRQYGGTGLGLSICRLLAEAMRGTISVSSNPGEGSVFQVTLLVQLAQSESPPESKSFRGVTALLLESHAVTRASIKNQLSGLGVQVVEITEQQLKLEGVTPSVVLVGESAQQDRSRITLPLVGTLREMYQTPVLLLSSTNDREDCPALQEAGVAMCIAKPLGRRQLMDALTRCFEQPTMSQTKRASLTQTGELRQRWLTGYRCLVADDNEINLALMRNLLTDFGASVITADNGKTALDQASKEPIDLICMDIRMPEVDGVAAAKQLRARQATANVPIIALTADSSLRNNPDFDSSIFDAIFVKPILERELRTLIGRTLHIAVPQTLARVPSPQDEGEQPVRDLDKALQISGGSAAMADELLAALCQTLPTGLAEIQQACADQDWSQMWERVHRMRGASASCAVPAFYAALARLSGLINTGNQESIGVALSEVQKQADRLVDYHWKLARQQR